MRILVVLALSIFLAGCACGPAAGPAPQLVAVAPPAPAAVCAAPAPQLVAAGPCAAAAAPQYVQAQVVAAPVPMAGGVQYVQVQYRTSAGSYVRAGLTIPGNLVICVGNFLRCAMEALFPLVTPEASYAPAAVQVAAPAPAAAPCVAAPAAPVAPAGRWSWTPDPVVAADPCVPSSVTVSAPHPAPPASDAPPAGE